MTIQERLQGRLADRYSVERELGKGGMATVFLAKDIRHDRDVAIKVLHPELSASIGAERFEREIKLSAKLQHPHILGLIDSGEADGLLYYVMPFVKGEALRDRLDREGQLPIEDAIQIALETADALGYAHAHGIIHRDIKPENILLSGGHALVADFGIARAATEAGAQKLTQTGMAVGTPVYMAPEQSVGDAVGPTSDLYSLGCVLYEMLAGEPPFTAKNPQALMARHAMEAVPSIRIVRNTVPEEVEDTIFAAMAKVPADRPQNAAQFAEMLGMPLGATASRRANIRTTASRRVPTGAVRAYQALPWWKRTWVLATAGGVVLAAGAAAYLLSRGRPAGVSDIGVKKIAVLEFEDQSKDKQLSYLAEGLTGAVIATLSSVSDLTVRSLDAIAPFRNKAVAIDSIGRALDVGTIVKGTLEPEADKIRVSFRVFDAVSASEMSNGSLSLPAANQLAIRDSVTRLIGERISDHVRELLHEQVTVREQRAGTSNAVAWTLVQRAERARLAGEAADSAELQTRQFQAADSLFAEAERQDPKWVEPVVLRAVAAYRHAYILRPRDRSTLKPWIDQGLGHVERALAMGANNPAALEVRGNLKYLSWLANFETNADQAKALLLSAEADLEKATSLDQRRAGAWATLSHLYNQIPEKSGVDVNLAATKALEADAYLSNADVITWRMFLSDYDLGQFDRAAQTCDRAQQRFATNVIAVRCRLFMLTTKNVQPNVAEAWQLADSIVKLTPERRRDYQRMDSDMFVAWVIARASQAKPELADSARHVAVRSEGTADIDPTRDLALRATFVYVQLGDHKEAIRALKLYLAVNPQRQQSYAQDPGWQIRPIRDDPEFKRLVGSGS